MYLHVLTCTYMYLHVSTCTYMYLHVLTCTYMCACSRLGVKQYKCKYLTNRKIQIQIFFFAVFEIQILLKYFIQLISHSV